MTRRTYHDPLHGEIVLDNAQPAEAMAMALIDAPAFQRLRRIRQLGPAFLTFHGAESSRFTHSLGVLHLARRALGHLERQAPELAAHRGLLYGAALLHDVGHGPLSHSGEEMFGLRHEAWSARLIRERPDLHGPLEAYAPGTAEAVALLLEKGQAPHPAIAALVSSQLDCDRLDYLRRDSYSTGTAYGQLDLDRLIGALTLAPDGQLALHPRGRTAVEHYLVVRSLMYGSVYNHRLNIVCNWLLDQIVSQARRLGPGQMFADSVLARWLWHTEELSSSEYLANDDLRTGYHLLRWREEGPAPCRSSANGCWNATCSRPPTCVSSTAANGWRPWPWPNGWPGPRAWTPPCAAAYGNGAAAAIAPTWAGCGFGMASNSRPWSRCHRWWQVLARPRNWPGCCTPGRCASSSGSNCRQQPLSPEYGRHIIEIIPAVVGDAALVKPIAERGPGKHQISRLGHAQVGDRITNHHPQALAIALHHLSLGHQLLAAAEGE